MSQAFIGEIRLLPYTYAPRGWAWCYGQIMNIGQNPALFSILGKTFGGDGTSTFALPNLMGLTPMHSGTGIGLHQRVFGKTGGEVSVPLNLSQFPSHNHTLSGADVVGTQGTPDANVYPSRDKLNKRFEPNPNPSNMVTMSSLSLSPAGPAAALPHENRQPYLVVNHCICMDGEYPVRN
jgi:microcystin-dependent protein